ncbi:MAG TPA: agmatinase [Spirochaetota bacterium]
MSELTRGIPFFGSKDSVDDADIVLMGIPYDCTASFRPGARFAPREMRSYALEGIEEFSFALERSIEECSFYDAGDLPVICGAPSVMVERARAAAAQFVDQGKRMLTLGGEHLITYPVFLAYAAHSTDFTILHLDAHADLREGYLGDDLSHASVMNLCLKKGLPKLIQYGIRSGSREEFEMRRTDARIVAAQTLSDIEKALSPGEKVYLSIDVDFFDPGFFPGTGTPEPGGYSYNEFLSVVKILEKRNVKLVGADIVELAPQIDSTGNSTVFAAKLLRDLLIVMGKLS